MIYSGKRARERERERKRETDRERQTEREVRPKEKSCFLFSDISVYATERLTDLQNHPNKSLTAKRTHGRYLSC